MELSKRTNVPLSAKLWDQAIEAFITTGQAEGVRVHACFACATLLLCTVAVCCVAMSSPPVRV